MLVKSREAVAILRKEANRPNASAASLNGLVKRGLITPVKIHCRLWGYNPEQVADVARKLNIFGEPAQ